MAVPQCAGSASRWQRCHRYRDMAAACLVDPVRNKGHDSLLENVLCCGRDLFTGVAVENGPECVISGRSLCSRVAGEAGCLEADALGHVSHQGCGGIHCTRPSP